MRESLPGPRPLRGAIAAASALILCGCGGPAPGAPPTTETACPDVPDGLSECFARTGIAIGATSWKLKTGPMNGAALGDCDGDGLPDAFVFNWLGEGRLYRNRGGFRFEDVTAASGVTATAPNAAAFGDLDNDGRPDLLVAFGIDDLLRFNETGAKPLREELRVYRNEGACRFTDVTRAAGIERRDADGVTILAGVDLADLDLDGRLDLMLRRLSLDGAPQAGFYLSRPDGTFAYADKDVLGAVGGSTWSNLIADVDGDDLADVFFLADGRFGSMQPARYFRRAGPSRALAFAEAIFDPKIFGAKAEEHSLMAGIAGDVDGDERLDIYLMDIGPQHLYTHKSGLTDVGEAAGVAVGKLPDGAPTVAFAGSFSDYDNDTWTDLVVAASITDGFLAPPTSFLLRNRGDGTFEERTARYGLGGTHKNQWLGASDLDRDGRIDLWFGGEGELPRVYRNQIGDGRSIAVRLRGRTSNAEGVGAKVTVQVGARRIVQPMSAGGGPWGYGEHRLVFGLAGAAGADAVEVRWPDGYVQRAGAVAAGKELLVEEPELVRVEPAVGRPADTLFTLRVKPARPDGAPLGPGHAVTASMGPGAAPLVVMDQGDGSYVAQVKPQAPGLFDFTVTIDGAPLLAHPRILVR